MAQFHGPQSSSKEAPKGAFFHALSISIMRPSALVSAEIDEEAHEAHAAREDLRKPFI